MFMSMTGFARKEIESPELAVSLQLKSYNNRYLDISISLPQVFSSFEPGIQKLLSDGINRGKVEFQLRVRRMTHRAKVLTDIEAARAAYAAFSEIAAACGIEDRPSLAMIASFDGVLSPDRDIDEEGYWPLLRLNIDALLADFAASRAREGEATERDVFSELDRFALQFESVKLKTAEIESTIKRQLATRFAEMLPQGYDEQRMLQEVAIQLVRLGINEEVSRLDAHIAAFRDIAKGESPSRKLDFLCQEMNREVNTIGSKNMLVQVAHAVVEMKDSLENIREQLRNVE
jgi:uncharacterized protein (TIGR00255 family)